MSDTFTDRKTTFRRFTPKTSRQCNGCRGRIDPGASAWKPTKDNHGGWMPSAVLCKKCGDEKLKEASGGA